MKSEKSKLLQKEDANAVAYSFGHLVYYDGEDWRYEDGTLKTDEERQTRKCPHCGETPTEEGHDPCISDLPAVDNACCGHGKERGYISFENGTLVRGYFTTVQSGDSEQRFDILDFDHIKQLNQ